MLPQSNSVQNLSHLTVKTKELRGVGGKHPLPLVLHQPKTPGMNRVKTRMLNHREPKTRILPSESQWRVLPYIRQLIENHNARSLRNTNINTSFKNAQRRHSA